MFLKIWRAFLGIATEVAMTVLIMATAYGLGWLIIKLSLSIKLSP